MPEVCLLGSPVSHSLSPVFQNAAFAALNMDGWVYRVRDVEPSGMRHAATMVRNQQLAGANITLPHKGLAAELAERRTPLVELCGAANTWWRDDRGRLNADNTDVAGLVATLDELGVPRRQGTAIVLGAGGSARAAVVALASRCERIVVVNRTLATARDLCTALLQHEEMPSVSLAALAWPHGPRDAADVAQAFEEAQLLIHATSASTRDGASEAEAALRKLPWASLSVMTQAIDLAYARSATPFVAMAAQQGLSVTDGACMLVAQGAASFTRWTDRAAPFEVMKAALAKALGRQSLLTVPGHKL
jgi:shikimate dehydrogenase